MEDPARPFVEALIETVQEFVLRPREAFRKMAPEGFLDRAVGYAILLGWIGLVVSRIYDLVFRGAMTRLLGWQFEGLPVGGGVGAAIGAIVLGPLVLFVVLVVWTALVHAVLALVGGANRGIGTTLKAVAYSQTAALAQIVPFCGGFVAGIWALVLLVFGLAEAHGTSDGRAAAAALLPLILCCVCGLLFGLVSGAGVASLMSR